MSVHLCFGLLASNKQTKTCLFDSVESTVKHIAKHGTYADSSMTTKVFDSYEVLDKHDMLRAFIDLDIKRYLDKRPILPVDGVVLKLHIETVLEELVSVWEAEYGRGRCWKLVSHQEFEKLAPEVLKLEEKLRKVLGLRPSRSKKDSEFLRASHLVNDALESWSATVVNKTTHKKRSNGIMIRVYTIYITPIITNIMDSLN